MQQAVRTLAIAVDRELAASVRELQRLAEFPTLNIDQLDEFTAYASNLVATQAAWSNIVLVDADGQQLLNTRALPGEKLPVALREHHREVFRTGMPALSDLYRNTRDGQPSAAIGVPVRRDGQVRWVLSARLNATQLPRLLSQQAVRADLVASVLDRNRLLVARNRHHERFYGQPATADLQAQVLSKPSGQAALQTLEGVRVVAAWETLPLGWVVTVGIPQEEVDGPIRRQLLWLALGGLLALAMSLWLSLSLARRLERGVAQAMDDARALAEGRAPSDHDSRVRELAALFEALRTSHARLMRAAADTAHADATLRQSEERLRLATEAVKLGTFDWHLGSDTLIWSDRTRALFGFSDDHPVHVEDALLRVHPDDQAGVRSALQAAMRVGGSGEFLMQYRVLPPQAPMRWVDVAGRVIFDGEGGAARAVRFIGVVRDITEQKAMELSLREADRRKDEFLAMLSHELRNPLTPIANALTILRMQAASAAASERALAIAERQVQQMKRLIDDLLDISRITRGK
ncbi:MAG: PAS domain-containing protein, partial [Burkholderiaceae bacterium]|nr:PAS domain-containing protein [Burkholderiaceae bacterium]